MRRQLFTWHSVCLIFFFALLSQAAFARADLNINTPTMQAIKSSMQQRHAQLMPYYQSGAVGFTADGWIAVRAANQVPLAQRPALAALVEAENNDRAALYLGIANANQHPEWAGEIQRVFALRWLEKAQSGWYLQRDGQWSRK